MDRSTKRSSSPVGPLLVLALLLGLVAGASFTLGRRTAPASSAPSSAELLADPWVRRGVVQRLAAEVPGVADSHPDPDVTRLFLYKGPGSEGEGMRHNSFGVFEKEWDTPKPEGRLRIVMLGDSFVFGAKVDPDQRMGAVLARELRERVPGLDVEALHIGVPSWNVRTETAYLRRRLSTIEPDLVFQISYLNDLDATVAVRGFGGRATYSDQERWRADAPVSRSWPAQRMGVDEPGYLSDGLDHESRRRYAEMGRDIGRLSDALARRGVPLRVLFHNADLGAAARAHVGPFLQPAQPVYLSAEFFDDLDYRISAEDPHWNPAGHARIAALLAGLILRDDLLPGLDLGDWPESSAALEELSDAADADPTRKGWRGLLGLDTRAPVADLRFDPLDARAATQVHAGVDADGRASPHVSVIADGEGAGRVLVSGRGLPRDELTGLVLQVLVDGVPVGRTTIPPGADFEVEAPLPGDLPESRYRTVELRSSDYAHDGHELRNCVSFDLDRIALLP